MRPILWLISEGVTDAPVIQKILDQKAWNYQVNPIFPSGAGGVSRLADQIEEAIQTALHKKSSQDCIVVLHDADIQTEQHRKPYQRIAEACNQYQNTLVYMIAYDALEAWLLADSGLHHWLNIPAHNYDERQRPKDILDSYLVRQNRKLSFCQRYLDSILANVQGTGDRYSPSMKRAFQELDDCCK
jgi:hypothetical protein